MFDYTLVKRILPFSLSEYERWIVISLYHFTISFEQLLKETPFSVSPHRHETIEEICSNSFILLYNFTSHLMNAIRWASIAVAHTSSNSLYIIIIEHQFRFNCEKRVLNTPHRTAYVGLNVEKFMRIHLLDDSILLRGCR